MTHVIAASTETALRTAMARLLAGKPTATDGALTVTNLAAEAGTSRATANRATAILNEFRAAIRKRSGKDPGPLREAGATELQAARETAHTLAQHIQALALYTREQQDRIAALETELAGTKPGTRNYKCRS